MNWHYFTDGEQKRGRKALALSLLPTLTAIVGFSACVAAQTAPRLVASAPEWRVGDRWRHAWTAGTEAGVKTSEVLSVREIGGVQFYVLRVDAVDRYYTLDLHWAANVLESRVAARVQPPQPWFMWPLEVGRRWEYRGTYEDQERKDQLSEVFRVVGVERVEVPAGTFWAFKLERQGTAGASDEYWYAPEVHWYVKWVGRRGPDQFQEVLQEYIAGTGETPSAPATDRPAGGRN